MDRDFIEQYRDLFLEELDEQIFLMDKELLNIEQDGVSEAGIQSLFRAAHTIKGSAAAMGIESIKSLTHEMEQILDGIRSHRLKVTAEIIDVLFSCLDYLMKIKENLFQEGANEPDISGIVERLKSVSSHQGQEGASEPASRGENNEGSKMKRRLQIEISLLPASEMKLARSTIIYNKLLEHAHILSCHPSLDAELEDSAYQTLRMICETSWDPNQLEQFLLNLMDVESVHITAVESSDEQVKTAPSKRNVSNFIRVSVEHLEHLINLIGELVIDQTRLNQIKNNLIRKYQADEDAKELEYAIDHANKVISDLQDSMMKTRMIPIEQLFNRFPRMVRDLSHELGKEVELTLEGGETELDRSLIEELGDPLIHLIRNAVDHGIENAQKREAAGKPRKGQLRIRASHENNQVVIRVSDDGAGIDLEKVKKTAIEKKIMTEEEAKRLTDYETIQLIFHAGFSTSSEVSDISGRGVGMDIVRSDIERLNGLIDIETQHGKGTTFTIRLPLTLAIITGLLVEVNRQTFILPMGNVSEITKISSADIQSVRGKEIVMNRGQVVPLIRLNELLGMEASAGAKEKIPVVIAGIAEKRVALLVDHLVGNQEIVIKSLGRFIGKVDFISGATILGDGKIAFILEVSDILKAGR